MSKAMVYIAHAGCLLPILLILNLFFGWLIFKPLIWIGLELVLLLGFVLSSYVFAKSILYSRPGNNEAIDVEAEVIEEKPRLE